MAFRFVLFLALLNNINGKYQMTDSCPSGIVQWKRREALFQCPTRTPYHCILLYNTSQLYEGCMAAVTIGPGQAGCPWIQFYNDRPIHGSKNSYCPVKNPECPPRNHKGYLSNQLYLYQACFLYRSARLSQISTTFTTISLSTTVKQETNSSSAFDNSTDQPFQIWIAVVVALIVLVAVVLMILMIWRRKITGMCKKAEGSTQENEEEKGNLFETMTSAEDTGMCKKDDGSTQENEEKEGKLIETMTSAEDTGHGISYSTSSKDETRINEWNSTNNRHSQQQQEIFDEKLVHSVFRSILDISDGIVSYEQLNMHFEEKEDCSNIVDNLENILKGNRKLFRLIEDERSICFVIAYIPEADICENYNHSSEARKCVSSCTKFHVCSSYVKGLCRIQECTLSHAYGDEHNMKVKDRLRLSSYSDSDINNILLNCYPKICSIDGCGKERDCPFLHICSKFCFKKCSDDCPFIHSFRTKHNAKILKAYGISDQYGIWNGSPIARKITIAKSTYNSD